LQAKEQEFQRKAAAMMSSMKHSSTKAFVTVRNLAVQSFGSASTVVPHLSIPDFLGEPTAVHGGILLGVSVASKVDQEVDKLLLYDWNGGLLTAGTHSLVPSIARYLYCFTAPLLHTP
jgi:drug/metabolite transporter superfamily protein YnfA